MESYSIENKLWEKNYKNIACIDEVGRGCLYGDVVAAAVILPPYTYIEGVKDSKKISENKRRFFYDIIYKKAIAIGIGRISSRVIDDINIKQATKRAMILAVENLENSRGQKITPDYLLIDAETLHTAYPQESFVRGEDLVHGIAAASIVAKVHRDTLCKEWSLKDGRYALDKNKGYGTKEHREAILKYGPTDNHRFSFLKKILK
ncbi:ribonuclease HII [Tindallia californiensis]|uniref:Ribonuclease n=1 Tax=Tindallia californiensis TaxID=159292 RepID=A0A1H3NSS2_9FIRM|nr:ribonuclease HII [Tindallia californiensis]SDY91942.1 RNase HII [Tindallia californiensis]